MFVSFLDGTESSEMRYGNDENDFWGCERWLMREATERNLKIEQIGKSKPEGLYALCSNKHVRPLITLTDRCFYVAPDKVGQL